MSGAWAWVWKYVLLCFSFKFWECVDRAYYPSISAILNRSEVKKFRVTVSSKQLDDNHAIRPVSVTLHMLMPRSHWRREAVSFCWQFHAEWLLPRFTLLFFFVLLFLQRKIAHRLMTFWTGIVRAPRGWTVRRSCLCAIRGMTLSVRRCCCVIWTVTGMELSLCVKVRNSIRLKLSPLALFWGVGGGGGVRDMHF